MRDFYETVAAAREAHSSPDFGLAGCPPVTRKEKVPAKVYGVMAFTTMLTFATLTTGYQYLFTHSLYA